MSRDDIGRPAAEPVRCAILTVSDTRTIETDTSGRAIADLLIDSRHLVIDRQLVPDEPSVVARLVLDWTTRQDPRVIITTGGTGLAARDSTYDALHKLFEKEVSGFGELFRMLSFHEIGAAAMLSRATAGTIHRTAIFLLPGSEHAVRLAMTRLILPELGHLSRELTKTT